MRLGSVGPARHRCLRSATGLAASGAAAALRTTMAALRMARHRDPPFPARAERLGRIRVRRVAACCPRSARLSPHGPLGRPIPAQPAGYSSVPPALAAPAGPVSASRPASPPSAAWRPEPAPGLRIHQRSGGRLSAQVTASNSGSGRLSPSK